MKKITIVLALLLLASADLFSQRPADLGIKIGVLPIGSNNAITDVAGVRVGHVTLIDADSIRTGVTAILPHTGNIFQEKVPAAMYLANGFGKLTGISQVRELGNIETPVILTNTLSVPMAAQALVEYTLLQNPGVRSVNPVVGETNDGYLNDIRGLHVERIHIFEAISNAREGPVEEGAVGAGTGTICFGFKGGIGTSSRKLPESLGGYTVGVLVQTNFGGVLKIDGVSVGEKLGKYSYKNQIDNSDGSCMIVIATDAPMSDRNLERLAKRGFLGLGNTGGYASNGSGDYIIAFSTYEGNRIPYRTRQREHSRTDLHNDFTSPLFLAAVEATEEAIINSLFAARSMTGHRGTIEALPRDEVLQMLKKRE